MLREVGVRPSVWDDSSHEGSRADTWGMPKKLHHFLVFVPEGPRDATAVPVDLQDQWVVRLVHDLTRLFGGATSYGRGVGAWRTDDRADAPIHWDRITVVECWIDAKMPDLRQRWAAVGEELVEMCAALNQQVVGCIVDGEWWFYSKKGRR